MNFYPTITYLLVDDSTIFCIPDIEVAIEFGPGEIENVETLEFELPTELPEPTPINQLVIDPTEDLGIPETAIESVHITKFPILSEEYEKKLEKLKNIDPEDLDIMIYTANELGVDLTQILTNFFEKL